MAIMSRKAEVNGVRVDDYLKHPRILELRLISIHASLLSEFGEYFTNTFIKLWCDSLRINSQFIWAVINQRPAITKLRLKYKRRYLQEMVFMGYLHYIPRTQIGTKYLGLSKSAMYRKEFNLDVEDFLNQDWVNELDYTTVVCGVKQYQNDTIRFLEALERLALMVNNVPLASLKL